MLTRRHRHAAAAEALIGPTAWEFAALGYFLGWPMADATLAAYATDRAEITRLRDDATAIGLCFGVYRWAQDREQGADEDEHGRAFLLQTLSRMWPRNRRSRRLVAARPRCLPPRGARAAPAASVIQPA